MADVAAIDNSGRAADPVIIGGVAMPCRLSPQRTRRTTRRRRVMVSLALILAVISSMLPVAAVNAQDAVDAQDSVYIEGLSSSGTNFIEVEENTKMVMAKLVLVGVETLELESNQEIRWSVIGRDGRYHFHTLPYRDRGLPGQIPKLMFDNGPNFPNFEDPQDENKDNIYEFSIAAFVVTLRYVSSYGYFGTYEEHPAAIAKLSVIVTDVGEDPPDAPQWHSIKSSQPSQISAQWIEPSRPGPSIDRYDLQIRSTPDQAEWVDLDRSRFRSESSGYVRWPVYDTVVSVDIVGFNYVPSKSYQLRVRGVNADGIGQWSQPSEPVNVFPRRPEFIIPTDLSVAENTTEVGVLEVKDSGDYQDIFWSLTDDRFELTPVDPQVSTSMKLSFKQAPNFEKPGDADGDGVYELKVTLSDGSDHFSATSTVTVIDVAEAPSAPGEPAVTPRGDTELVVEWDEPANPGPTITDYDVEYREGPTRLWVDARYSGSPESATSTAMTISGLTRQTDYEVRVQAYNDEGISGWSAVATATTGDAIPDPVDPPDSDSTPTPDSDSDSDSDSTPTPDSDSDSDSDSTPDSDADSDADSVVDPVGPSGSDSGSSDGSARVWVSRTVWPFVDVAEDSPHRESIGELTSLGIIKGKTATSFEPKALLTRAHIASFLARLWRKSGQDCPKGASVWADVGASSAHSGNIDCLGGLGIVTGTTEMTYEPYRPASRSSMASFLANIWRQSGNKCPVAEAPLPFDDVPGDADYADDVKCIYDLGITAGKTATSYDPGSTVTREQMASFLARLWRKLR